MGAAGYQLYGLWFCPWQVPLHATRPVVALRDVVMEPVQPLGAVMVVFTSRRPFMCVAAVAAG